MPEYGSDACNGSAPTMANKTKFVFCLRVWMSKTVRSKS